MDQPHLGYMSWRDPPVNSLQHITLKILQVPENAAMGLGIEGSDHAWPDSLNVAILPEFDVFNKQTRFIDIFNRGKSPFSFEINCDPWINVSVPKGYVDKDARVWVSVEWDKVPEEKSTGILKISGTGTTIEVSVLAFKPGDINPAE